MVYFYTSNVVTPSAFIYAGKDKFESMRTLMLLRYSANRLLDEELIKYGWEEDVW
jgi:hypothetical protein